MSEKNNPDILRVQKFVFYLVFLERKIKLKEREIFLAVTCLLKRAFFPLKMNNVVCIIIVTVMA